MHCTLGLALTGGLSIVVAACDAAPTPNRDLIIDGPQIPITTLDSSSSATGITGEANTGTGSGPGGTADTGTADTGDTGMADTDKADCSASGDACDKCCKATWGDGASGSLTDNKCTHCNVPQGSYQTYNECKAVCQELNCETETYTLGTGNCICGRCPGP